MSNDTNHPSVAVLGLGAMGQRMAARLLAAGHAVVVWNRTPQLAEPVVDQEPGVSKRGSAGSEA
ncbi:MAG TPA: NAD(P)-binding domain-containing protein [Vicinamibacterales bacterium]|jgi:3-hydroxyisobutyrate dehydrogenase-like beta-hydroxyacid dehydrogenase|nr:NAD(P)-binding domain-containing protein [Vicinamibacterales bacterium]HVH56670.1 NAD(P)-binding domain-containing protein [Vicinamibacterales bacterium]